MSQMTAGTTLETDRRRAARRRSVAFFVLVVLVAVVAGIVELSLTVWEQVGSPPGSGRAASLANPTAPASPTPAIAGNGGGPGGRTGSGTAGGLPPAPAGAFLHQNTATVQGGSPVICTDATSPLACGAVFSVADARPGSTTTGTVEIQTAATAPASLFQLGMASAQVSPPSSPLCGDLRLQITDSDPVRHVLFQGALTSMPTLRILDIASDAAWPPGGYGRFTFVIGLPASSGNADQNATCTVAVTWTQSPA